MAETDKHKLDKTEKVSHPLAKKTSGTPAANETRQDLVAKIRAKTSVLITVSRDPSVDQLAAALGLSLALEKMGKHVSAVFSGRMPKALNFLQPEKTFDTNADALRDFVISLSKDKADRLRYKVEGEHVKVFITPYRTKISADDLTFSEGDFNVDLVIALGVHTRDDLDAAVANNARILHDATSATIEVGVAGGLGDVNWGEPASSFCELIAKLLDDFSDEDVLDEPVATAILTGLVSSTDQFRNQRTSPEVMTLAAKLMGAGANQQLIASELSSAHAMDSSTSVEKDAEVTERAAQKGDLNIAHETTEEDKERVAQTLESRTEQFMEEEGQKALETAEALVKDREKTPEDTEQLAADALVDKTETAEVKPDSVYAGVSAEKSVEPTEDSAENTTAEPEKELVESAKDAATESESESEPTEAETRPAEMPVAVPKTTEPPAEAETAVQTLENVVGSAATANDTMSNLTEQLRQAAAAASSNANPTHRSHYISSGVPMMSSSSLSNEPLSVPAVPRGDSTTSPIVVLPGQPMIQPTSSAPAAVPDVAQFVPPPPPLPQLGQLPPTDFLNGLPPLPPVSVPTRESSTPVSAAQPTTDLTAQPVPPALTSDPTMKPPATTAVPPELTPSQPTTAGAADSSLFPSVETAEPVAPPDPGQFQIPGQ